MLLKKQFLTLLTVTIFFSLTHQAQAGSTINSVTLNGEDSITVSPGATVDAEINVTTWGQGSNDNWHSTSWQIGSNFNCVNHGDHNNDGNYTEIINIVAPNTPGTYDISFIAYRDNNCNNGESNTYSLENSIIVESAANIETIVDYRMDEGEWTGAAGEVKDSSPNSDNATAVNGANTLDNTTAGGGICRVGDFIRDNYLTPTTSISLPNNYTITLWIKFPLDPVNHAPYVEGWLTTYYYFNIADNNIDSNRFLYLRRWHFLWWNDWQWGVGNNNYTTFPMDLINNGWHMLAFVAKNDQNQTELYIDGEHENTIDNIINSGELMYLFTSNFNNDLSGQTLGSYADEFKIFNQALSETQIQQIYDNENNGKNWDGTERNCNQGTNISYYLIEHDGTGLTCQPEEVTVKACTDNQSPCTEYTQTTEVTLYADGNSVNTKNFTGNTTYNVAHETPDNVTLSLTGTPDENYICIDTTDSDPNSCVITFYDSGFVFDIPDNYSCKPQNNITIKAVRKDDQTQECVPAFADKIIPVNFAYTYVDPDNGTIAPSINNTSLNDIINLNFNSNGVSSFDFVYEDAGQIGISASFDNATVQAAGSDSVVLKPAGFHVYTDNSSWQAENGANSSVFAKAGGYFNVTAEAKCWESDSDTDFSNNPLTPNYQRDNISLSHNLLEPVGGNPGNIGISSLDFTNGIASVDNQTFSEVGIINFDLTDNDYLGAGTITGTSQNIGRFIPDHFKITSPIDGELTNQCSDTFTYTGQKTNYLVNPEFNITAQNKDNNTTQNYKGNFFKLEKSGIEITNPTTDANQTGEDGVNKVKVSVERDNVTLTSNSDGTATYTFGNDNITYVRDNNSQIAPFDAVINFEINSIIDNDSVSAVNLPDNISASGTEIRYGRMNILNNYGPETEPLTLPLKILYWNNNQWELNTADSCTSTKSTLSDFELTNWQDKLNAGETNKTYVGDNDSDGNTATYQINLSKPGEGNQGSVDVIIDDNSSLYNYLWDNETTPGTATFGIYRGRDSIIEWKEIPAE